MKNSYWSLADVVLYPVLMMLLTPLYIRYLGVDQYGIWMFAGNIAQMMNMLNMGVSESTIRQVSKFRVENNEQGISDTVNRNLFLSLLLFAISCLLGILISVFIPLLPFKINPEDLQQAGLFVILLSASVGIRFIELVLLSVYKGYERFDISAKLSAVSRNSVVLGGIVVLFMGYGFLEILVLTLCLNVCNILIQLVCIRKSYAFLKLRPVFNKNTIPEIVKTNGWYWLQFMIAMTGFMADRFLVTYYAGTHVLGYYSIAALIVSQLHSIFGTLGMLLFPKVSYLLEKKADVKKLYEKAQAVLVGGGWLLIGGLIVFGKPVFVLWLGEETYAASEQFIVWYLVYESVMLTSIIPYQFINGTNHVKFNSLFELVLRSLQVILMIVFYHQAGIIGIIYGITVAALVTIPLQFIYFGSGLLKERAIPMLTSLLPLLFFIPMAYTDNTWIRVVLLFGIAVVYYRTLLIKGLRAGLLPANF